MESIFPNENKGRPLGRGFLANPISLHQNSQVLRTRGQTVVPYVYAREIIRRIKLINHLGMPKLLQHMYHRISDC